MNVLALITRSSAAASLLLVCGLPTTVAAAPKAKAPGSAVQSPVSNLEKIGLIKSTLVLQPGDEARMQRALQSPFVFVQKENNQEFTRELIVHAKAGNNHVAQLRIDPAVVKSSRFVDEYVITIPNGLSEGEMAAMLMATGDYEFVEPNWKLFPLGNIPNDSQYGSSWQHNRIQSATAWDLHTGNSDIIVAICDSGIDTNHPDLQSALIPGYNAVDSKAQVDGGLIEDVNGHGTFVAGCAAAQGNNGTGVVGVGWDFSIMPIRVSNSPGGGASGFDILEGARWAVDNGANVINASFTGGSSSGIQSTANYIIDRGGLLFWSSGNDNAFVSFDAADLVLVGSTNSSDNRSGFSNFGPAVDLVAPGSSVRSTRRGGSYGNSSGTSFASPIAAGVGAMIFSVRSDLSGRDVQDILYQSVDDLGAPGRDNFFGRGRVNTFNAIQVAQAYTPRLILPIQESFDSATWMDLFSTTSGSVSTQIDPESTDSASVLALDSTDQITTVPIAGRSLPLIPGLSYKHKISGAQAGESYSIEVLLEDGSWDSIIDFTATGIDTDGYVSVALSLPVSFRRHGVELRITSAGSDATDQWRIDDFMVGELVYEPVAPFVDSFDSGIISNITWDENTGATIGISNASHAAVMVGDVMIESQQIPMSQFGFAPGFVRFDAWSNAGSGADDTVVVEVTDIIGNWVALGTIDGQTLGTTPSTIQYETPLTTWSTDTLRVRLSSAGNDPIYIDNLYVGPDQLNQMCSDADFAEPFGQLNFLDVSAFLTAYGTQSPDADLDGSGTFNFLDVSAFLNAYGLGCP